MTPLRQRMTEDMQLRGLAPATQQAYLRYVEQLAVFTGKSPDLATDEDFRQFFLALPSSAAAPARPRQLPSPPLSSSSSIPSSALGRASTCFVRVPSKPCRSSSASMRSGAFSLNLTTRPTTPASRRFDHLRLTHQRRHQPPGQLDRQRSYATPGTRWEGFQGSLQLALLSQPPLPDLPTGRHPSLARRAAHVALAGSILPSHLHAALRTACSRSPAAGNALSPAVSRVRSGAPAAGPRPALPGRADWHFFASCRPGHATCATTPTSTIWYQRLLWRQTPSAG
jgi:hypothetical protein